MKRTLFALFVLTLISTLAPAGFAQSQSTGGAIGGFVSDETGAVIPGVAIEARNTETNLLRTSITDENGRYNLPALPVGIYTVSASLSGFATAVVENVELRVGARLRVSFSMKVASVAETITVGTEAPLIETTRTTFTTEINTRSLTNLPIVARNFESFVFLTPGTLQAGRNTQSIGGGKGINSNYTLDGADRNNPFFGGQVGGDRPPFSVSLEAIKEFIVLNNGYNAEFGRSAGGLVNVVTKSGTNEFHGGAWYHLLHKELVRKDETRPAPLVPVGWRQQVGGDLGGPIVKDKLFFYGNTDIQRRIVPLVIAWRSTRDIAAGLGSSDANTRSAAQYLIGLQKTITGTDHLRSHLGRVDWNASTNNTIFARFNSHRSEQANGTHGFPRVIETAETAFGSELDRSYNTVAQWNWIMTPRAVNEFRMNYSWEDRPRVQNPIPGAATRNGLANGTQIEITGITGSRAGLGAVRFLPIPETDTRTQFTDSVSYTAGRHDLKFGGDYNSSHVNQVFRSNARGRVTYASFADFVRGVPTRIEQSFIPGVLDTRMHEIAFFAQDSWKVNRDFTLNWGIRWEGQINPKSSVPNPDFLKQTERIPNDMRQWAPRLGFAWNVNDKAVVRLMSGLFYSRTPMLLMSAPINENGDARKGTSLVIANCATSSIPCPRPFSPPNYGGPYEIPFDRFPGTLPATGTIAGGDVRMIDPNFKNSRTLRIGPSFEYEILPDTSLSVQYTYTFTTHLQRLRDVNLFPATVNAASGRPIYSRAARPYPFANFVVQTESSASARYNAVTVAVNRRFNNGFQAQGFYTYGRNFGHDDNERDASARNNIDPMNLNLDWGRSNLDVRHNIVSNSVWSLPWDIQASLILTGRSGLPWNATTGSDSTTQTALSDASGVLSLFRNLIGKPNATVFLGGNGDGSQSTDRPWVDGKPLARNFFSQNWFFNSDVRLTKIVRFDDRHRLELLADFLNATNRANRFTSDTVLSNTSATFGKPGDRNVVEPFSVQLGVKFVF